MSAPPGVIRFSTSLMWSVLPFGLLVTAVNALAVRRTAQRLPTTPPDSNASAVPAAIRYFDAWAWQRTIVIAAGFVVAALVYAMLAMAVRRGSRRHPAAVMVLSGAFAMAFAAGCWLARENDPIIAFRYEWIDVPGEPGSGGVPWIMPLIAPSWYAPALSGLLAAAVAAQLVAVLLLTRTRGGVWVTGLGIQTGGDPDAAGRRTRQAALLLVLQPVLLAAYATATTAAIRLAPAPPDDLSQTLASDHLVVLVGVVVIALLTLPSVVQGLVLLRRGRRPGPLGLATAGGFTVLYLLLFWYLAISTPGNRILGAGDPGLERYVLAWSVPAAYGTFALAVVTQLTALIILARRRLPY